MKRRQKGKVDRMADFHGVALVSSSQGRQARGRPLSGKSALRRALPLQTARPLCLQIYVQCMCVKKVIALTVPRAVLHPTNCENSKRSQQLELLGQTEGS